MINQIVEAVSFVLNSEFGDGYKIYTEEAEQEMENPCFFVISSAPKKRIFRGRKYFRTNTFCIQYIPAAEDIQTECNRVIERLFSCLEYIRMDAALIRGKKMEPEVKDGVLYFFVNYDFFVYEKKETENRTFGRTAAAPFLCGGSGLFCRGPGQPGQGAGGGDASPSRRLRMLFVARH